MTPRAILICFLALLAGTVMAMSIGIYMVGKDHKAAAVAFWGDTYDASDNSVKVDWGFIGNLIMPRGGPMVSPEAAGVCLDTPLPLVPIKVSADGRGQVLCGLGSNSMVMGFDVNKIDDAQFREAFKEAIADEYGDSTITRQTP